MPVIVGLVAVLFQFGILFIAYLSLVHETRHRAILVAKIPTTLPAYRVYIMVE